MTMVTEQIGGTYGGSACVNYTIKRTENPDVVVVFDDWCDDEKYEVVQFGHLWWKTFCVCMFIPEMGVPAFGDGHWRKMSQEFKTREEAREAMYAGDFKKI